MGKYFGIGGKRVGSVGNETYVLNQGTNIVKSKIIDVNDAKSVQQCIQRSRLENSTKTFNQLGKIFLKNCFEKKKKGESDFNAFVRLNQSFSNPFFKELSNDKNIMGLSYGIASKGSLGKVNTGSILTPVDVERDEAGDTVVQVRALPGTTALATSKTVGTLSGYLKSLIPWLKDGMYVNFISVYNEGVKYDGDPDHQYMIVNQNHRVITKKANFVVNSSSTETLLSKGLIAINQKTDDSGDWYITLANDEKNDFFKGCVYGSDTIEEYDGVLGTVAIVIADKNGNKIKVSNSNFAQSLYYEDLISKINANPVAIRDKDGSWFSTLVKILIAASYLAKKATEIIHDWPI